MTKVILPPINQALVDKDQRMIKEWYDKFKFLEQLQPLSDIPADPAGVDSIGGATGDFTLTSNFTVPGNALTLVAAVVAGAVKSSSPSAGVGYATGAGGTVTQASSKSTAVTLDKLTGQITMNSASLNGATGVSFTLNNSAIAATDTLAYSISGGLASAGTYLLTVDAIAAGSCRFSLRNVTAGALSEAVVINFAVIKGVTS